MRIKVLHLLSTLERKGPVLVALNRIQSLNPELFEQMVLTLSPEPCRSAREDFISAGIAVKSLNLNRLNGIRHGNRIVREIVQDWGADIVQSDGLRSDIINAGCKHGVKSVCTVHSVLSSDYIPKFGNILGRLMVRRHLGAIHNLNTTIACSDSVRKWLETKGRASTTVLNGVNTEHYCPSDLNKNSSLLARPVGGKVWIYAGQLIPRKNVPYLIRSFLKSRVSQTDQLYILGDGISLEECKAAANGCSMVHFLGFANNVADYLKQADYFVSTSHSEGLPMSILEAASCGLPILASDIPQHHEIAALASESVVIKKLFNEDDMAQGFDQLASLPYEHSAAHIRSVALAHFSNSAMGAGYQRVYMNLMN